MDNQVPRSGRTQLTKRFTPEQLRQAGRQMAQDGIKGDTIVAHINPKEASLLKARGGSGTINPKTGLVQYDLGNEGSDNSNDTASNGKDASAANEAASKDTSFDNTGVLGGFGQYGPGAPGSVANNGMMGSMVGPNGQLSQASGLSQLDKAAVGATSSLGMAPGAMTGINASQDIMNGVTPGLVDKAMDLFGLGDNPGGFLGSNGVLSGAGIVGGLFGGPPGAAGMAGLTAGLQGRDLGSTLGAMGGAAAGIGASTGAGYGATLGANGVNTGGINTSQGTASDPSLSVLTASPLDALPMAALPAQGSTFAPMGRVVR